VARRPRRGERRATIAGVTAGRCVEFDPKILFVCWVRERHRGGVVVGSGFSSLCSRPALLVVPVSVTPNLASLTAPPTRPATWRSERVAAA